MNQFPKQQLPFWSLGISFSDWLRRLGSWFSPAKSHGFSSGQARRFPHWSFMVGVLSVAFLMRFAAACGPLWLDEIWSLELAQQTHSTTAVVTELRTDNNHPLNTMYLQWVGSNCPPIVYRLPAVILGTASVGLAGWIAARWGKTESITASTLVASSYLLIHYCSEARGYPVAIFCAMLGWEALLRYFDSQRWPWVVCFWISCVIGPLGHPIFVHFLLAALCWSVASLVSHSNGWRNAARPATILFLLPLTVAGLQYWVVWRQMDLGGGPPYSMWQMTARTASLALGGPINGWGAGFVAMILVAVIAGAYQRFNSDKHYTGLFLLFAMAIPIVHAVTTRPPFLFPRYFLMAVTFVPFALSIVLAPISRLRRHGEWIYAAVLLTLIASNLRLTGQLVIAGRGQYLSALRYMSDSTDEPTLTISSDHNFGIRKLVEFYGRQLSSHKPIQYYDGNRWPPSGPRWLVLHRTAESTAPLPAPFQVVDGHRFQLEKTFDCAILSGWEWWCYRRE